MVRKFGIFFIVMALLLMFSACAPAATQQVAQPNAAGDGSAALVSALVNSPITASSGQTGLAFRGLLIDPLQGQARYIAARFGGRAILIPLSLVKMVSAPSGSANSLAFSLSPQADGLLAAAPLFDESAAANTAAAQQLDASAAQYWAQVAGSVPVTGAASPNPLYYAPGAPALPILDSKNHRLGAVSDVVLSADGRLPFLILAPDPSLKLSGGLIPIVQKALAFDPLRRSYTLTVSPDVLQKAPRFDPSRPLDFSVPGWDKDWNAFWQSTALAPTPTTAGSGPAVVGLLTGWQVLGSTGQILGAVTDWIFNPSGQALYIIVSSHLPSPRQGQLFVPVPWIALNWQPQENSLSFKPTSQIFMDAPNFPSPALLLSIDWLTPVINYWQKYVELPATTSQNGAGQPGWLAASQMRNLPVVDASKRSMGTVLDFTLGPDGAIRYAVLHSGGKDVPVPWQDFSYEPKAGKLLYTDDPLLFQHAPSFDSVNAIRTLSGAQEQDLRRYWGLK